MQELITELGVGRRTVERMLAAVRQVCAEVEEVETDEREKRWRIRPNRLTRALSVTAEEVAEVEAAARRLAEEGVPTRAAALRSVANKLRTAMDDAQLRRSETDIEALLASEGLASRPGPRVVVADGTIAALRHALLARQRITLTYRAKGGAPRRHLLEPCALLWGARPYLLAVKPGKPDAAVWRLDRVDAVEQTFEPCDDRPDLALPSATADCFGIWREPPFDVQLRFTPEAVEDAAAWRFHASQIVTPLPDGSLEVRFHAGGLEEMAHHLVTWNNAVEVIAPARLRQRIAEIGENLLKRHRTPAPNGITSSEFN